jgi:hypothetical protein
MILFIINIDILIKKNQFFTNETLKRYVNKCILDKIFMKGYLKKMELTSKKIKRGGHSKKDGQRKGSRSRPKKYRRKTGKNSGKSGECSFCYPKISQRMVRYAYIRKKIRMNMKTLHP